MLTGTLSRRLIVAVAAVSGYVIAFIAVATIDRVGGETIQIRGFVAMAWRSPRRV